MLTKELEDLIRPTSFLDHESPEVREFVGKALSNKGIGDEAPAREKAVALYYAVRDDVLYEVYDIDLSREGLRASTIARNGQGFCLQKSILYAAAVRSVGVPSRIVLADVRNHLASDRLKALIGGEVFFHALNSVHLDGRWVKATPVFNKLLCRLYGMPTLEFDGTEDSVYHPYGDGSAEMEFLTAHGEFDDVPYEFVMASMRQRHPNFLHGSTTAGGGSLAAEAGHSQNVGTHHD